MQNKAPKTIAMMGHGDDDEDDESIIFIELDNLKKEKIIKNIINDNHILL